MGGKGRKKSRVNYFELLSILYLLAVVLFIIIIAAVTNNSIFVVLIGFFPTVLTIIISLLIHEQYANQKGYLWIIPIIICIAFYFLGTNSFLLKSFDIEVLTGVNFLISLVYVMIVFMIFKKPKQTKTQETKVSEPIPMQIPEKKTLEEYIHSIEDKSKALNFVIGRVYSKFHGGSETIREKLRIPAEWYNEFSLIGLDGGDIDKDKLLEIVTKFELQLGKFEKTETEVFKTKVNDLKNLIRNPNGSDKIIDVIDHNDKDPVRSYYEGAVEFCKKIREETEQDSLTLIKNEYIPKTPEEEAELKGVPTSNNFAKPKQTPLTKQSREQVKKKVKKEEESKPKFTKDDNEDFDDSESSPTPKFYHP